MIDVAFDKTAVIELGDEPVKQAPEQGGFGTWSDQKLEEYYAKIYQNPVVDQKVKDRVAHEIQRRRQQQAKGIPQGQQPNAPQGVVPGKGQGTVERVNLGDVVIARGLKVKGLEQPTVGKFEGILTTSQGQKYALFISQRGNAFVPFAQIGQYLVKANVSNVANPGVQANLRF
jgi:hypothetical protein